MNRLVMILSLALSLIACNNATEKKQSPTNSDERGDSTAIVYETNDLIIEKLSDHVYRHESFLTTRDFGKVPCNGMIVVNANEAIVFDTPASEGGSDELIKYLTNKLKAQVKAVVATHFHEDCVAGLDQFIDAGIPAFANTKTISLLDGRYKKFSKQIQGFDKSYSWDIGDKKVFAQYFGAGHTRDNIVGYFAGDSALFGGCLVKELNASKGNLADADTLAWSQTIQNVKQQYPQVKIVIPGHGKWGGPELLDYTIRLFDSK